MKKKALILFLLIGAVSMIIMSPHYLHVDDSGILGRKEIDTQWWYLLAFRTHVLFGLMAITTGPWQFIRRLRRRYLRLHQVTGYVYAASIILSGCAGLVVAPFAMGGLVSAIGFSLLATCWLVSIIMSVLAARRGDLPTHQRWSFYSYALTFAAITQRTLLLIPLLTSVPFMPVYQLSAWLPWLLNIGIAHWLYRSGPGLGTNLYRGQPGRAS